MPTSAYTPSISVDGLNMIDPRPQFYIQLVYKATFSFTFKIQIVSGSLFQISI